MTTSRPEDFPAAISIEDLKQLHKSATTEASAQSEGSEPYQERIERVSAEIIEEMSEKFDDHMIPKLVILRLIAQMAGWAVENQQRAAEHNDLQHHASFTAMASQLAASSVAIQHIYMGEEDFTHPVNDIDDKDSDPA